MTIIDTFGKELEQKFQSIRLIESFPVTVQAMQKECKKGDKEIGEIIHCKFQN